MQTANKLSAIPASRNGQHVTNPLQEITQAKGWRSWFQWENLRVSGREVKGFVIPGWAAGVLLAAILSAFAFMYSQNQSQREMLVRLDQKLEDKKEIDKQKLQEIKEAAELSGLKAEQASKRLATIEGILAASDRRVLDQLTK